MKAFSSWGEVVQTVCSLIGIPAIVILHGDSAVTWVALFVFAIGILASVGHLMLATGVIEAGQFGKLRFPRFPKPSSTEFKSTTSSQAIAATAKYDSDLAKLDGKWKLQELIGPETVIIVVGGSEICELLDRPTAELLRSEIDRRGVGHPFRRALILAWDYWNTPSAKKNLLRHPTLSIGSRKANPLTGEIEDSLKLAGNQPWKQNGGLGAIQIKCEGRATRVAVWGGTATDTRKALMDWMDQPRGLAEFLRDHAKWG